ncbi:MAG: diaminopimelate epimerase [Buchnera aphidicola (Periphyllus aceris)]|nr:diaminopimelate epimerase [Buchnera aphidicola (Periphyllus aceris)]
MNSNKNQLKFSKMHGLKNDFMIVETLTQNFFFTKKIIQNFSNRRTGIGFDQLLIIERPKIKNTNFHYRIFNANGSEVEQCGNGARCFAKFVFDKKFINKKTIIVSTKNRILTLKIKDKENILVNMGTPEFQPNKIPLLTPKKKNKYSIEINSEKYFFGAVSIGNPHCVILVKDIDLIKVKKIGSIFQNISLFPRQVNVGFMKILNRNEIFLRVFERGVGETQACGSGACAAVAIGVKQNKLSNNVKVHLIGGDIKVNYDLKEKCIFMCGPAEHIYDGLVYY